MNLVRLEYFLEVVNQGTVTAAATKLHVAQSAVSRQLQALEHEVGFALFDRENNRLLPTSGGREFAELARLLVNAARRADEAAAAIAAGVAPHLVLAAPQTSIVEIVAPFIATLSPLDPFIRAEVVPTEAIQAALRHGADMVISTATPVRAFAWRSLISAPLLACVPRSHPWARESRQSITLAELVDEKLILPPADHVTRRLLDRAVSVAGLQYGDLEEIRPSHVIQALAAAGFGVGVVTDNPGFDTHPVTIESPTGEPSDLSLNLHIAWDRNHYAAATISSLADRLAAHANGERKAS